MTTWQTEPAGLVARKTTTDFQSFAGHGHVVFWVTKKLVRHNYGIPDDSRLASFASSPYSDCIILIALGGLGLGLGADLEAQERPAQAPAQEKLAGEPNAAMEVVATQGFHAEVRRWRLNMS
jgi:hypothetical protein